MHSLNATSAFSGQSVITGLHVFSMWSTHLLPPHGKTVYQSSITALQPTAPQDVLVSGLLNSVPTSAVQSAIANGTAAIVATVDLERIAS